MKYTTILLLLLYPYFTALVAQEEISLDDYHRAVGYLRENYLNKKAFNLHVQPHWFPDSTGVWFVHHSIDEKKYFKISLPGLVQSELFDHQRLAQILSDSLESEIEASNLPISQIQYQNPTALMISANDKTYLLNLNNYSLSLPPAQEPIGSNERLSPDEEWIAYSQDYNLFIKSTKTEKVKSLSSQGKKGYEYATWYGWGDIMEGENGERPAHFNVSWSENSDWLYANICDLRSAQKMYLLDWSVDTLFRPRLLSYYRGSPGDTAMIYMEPVFFNVQSGQEIKTGLPKSTHINSIGVTWSKTPGKVFLNRSSRGYQNLYIYSFDLNTQQLDTLYKESSQTNIDNFSYELSEDNNLIFFLSEKSGWRQLYSLDLQTKEEVAITKSDYYVHRIVRIDNVNRTIYFTASGKEEDRNPYYQLLYKVSFSGENLKLLTPEDGHHDINISPDGTYFIDNCSTVNMPTRTVLRNSTNGQILMELSQADVSLLKDWSPPEIFTATARDGQTTIYGAIWKPTQFDPSKRYPVIEMSYTGPHTQVFPQEFSRVIGITILCGIRFLWRLLLMVWVHRGDLKHFMITPTKI